MHPIYQPIDQPIYQYFDCHNHLPDYSPIDLESVLQQSIKENVTHSVPNATHSEVFPFLLGLAKKYPPLITNDTNPPYMQIIPSFGVHPCFIHKEEEPIENTISKIEEILEGNPLFGVGEIGLDYRKDTLINNPKQKQLKYFTSQLELSFKMNRPVTVHCVRAHGEMLKILKDYDKQMALECANIYQFNPLIMHSYSGSKEITASLNRLTHLNIHYSMSLKFSEELCQEAIVPLNRLLIETDAPFQLNPLLAPPTPLNRVANIRFSAAAIATLYGKQLGQFTHHIYHNSLRVFRLVK